MSNNTIIATGYRSNISVINESGGYGIVPTNTTYSWIGATTEAVAKLDQKPIIIYRLDGISRFPAFILQGARELEVDLTYFPQNIALLNDMINFPQSNSHTIAINYTDISQGLMINGAVANTIAFEGKTGAALATTVTYWAQNISSSLPTGITFPTDPGNIPFYFVNQSVTFAGTTLNRVLSFNATVTNELERVYQFGQAFIRALPRKNAMIEGTITATFADFTDLNNVINMSSSTLVINLGNDASGATKSLTISSCVFYNVQVPSKPEDLIALTLPFYGQGVTVS